MTIVFFLIAYSGVLFLKIFSLTSSFCASDCSASDGRAVYVLYLSTPGIISVVVVNPFQNKELTSSLLEKQFREACRASPTGNALQDGGISFKVQFHVRIPSYLIYCYHFTVIIAKTMLR